MKPTPKLLERATAESAESDPRLEQYIADLKLLAPEDRRKRLQAMIAKNPRLTAPTLAEVFGVSVSTIDKDMMLLKEGARARFAGDPDLRVDLFKPFEDIRDASISDAALVDVDSPNRASHRRTAVTAHEKLIDLMFRCGYIAEAPKRVAVGQDPDLPPLQVASTLTLLADPEACDLATQLIARLSGGDEPITDETTGPDDTTEG
jgi:hypothetical protein